MYKSCEHVFRAKTRQKSRAYAYCRLLYIYSPNYSSVTHAYLWYSRMHYICTKCRGFCTLVLFIFTVSTSIMAQFKDINPYLWPGWFIAALGVFEIILILLFFTETRSLPSKCRTRCLSLSTCLQLKTCQKTTFFVSVLTCLISCKWISGTYCQGSAAKVHLCTQK